MGPRHAALSLHVGVGPCAVSRRAGHDGLSQAGPVGKERCRLCLHVVLPLCEVELGRHWAHLCIGGRVEAVGSCCPGSERSSSLSVPLLLGESGDLAVESLALDNNERVDALDRLTVLGSKAEHVVEHNGALRQRLGGDEQALTKSALRKGREELGKLGLDAVGANDYVTSGESEDGLVGEQGEAFIAWCDRRVELRKERGSVEWNGQQRIGG